MKHRGHSHEFALYQPSLAENMHNGGALELADSDTIHRISRVLRLDAGDELILFNEKIHAQARIKEINKKCIFMQLTAIKQNKIIAPHISLFLPLLKRDALEQAVYAAAELGINEIQLIITEKSRHHWNEKEQDRLKSIVIAAAEQSKHFALPVIHAPILLSDLRFDADETRKVLFFDPDGVSMPTLLNDLKNQPHESYSIIVGPEGDLTDVEKFHLQQQKVTFVRLTPTVLRACQAVVVGAGILRSFLPIA